MYPKCLKNTKEYLVIKNRKRKINPPILNKGKYWYDNPIGRVHGTVDLVSNDDNKGYIVYEAKYTNSKIKDNIIEWEKKREKSVG